MKRKINLDKIISILGRRGTGKTTLLRYHVNAIRPYCPIFIFDQVHNFNDKSYHYIQENTQYDPKVFYEKNRVFVKQSNAQEDFTQFCDDILMLYKQYNGRYHCYLVVDEIYLLVNNTNLDAECNKSFKEILVAGRNYGIGLLFASQRPQILNKTILSQSNIVYCYHLYLERDLDAISDYFDIEKVKNLKQFHFLGFFPDDDNKTIEFNPIKMKGEKVATETKMRKVREFSPEGTDSTRETTESPPEHSDL